MAMTKEEYLQLKQQNSNASSFRLVLMPHFQIFDNMTDEEKRLIEEYNEPIEFDTITSMSTTISTEMTTFPTVSGDMIADHIIKQPNVVQISGMFSLYGNKPTSFKGGNDRLTNIETFFEKLNIEAIKCSLVFMETPKTTTSKQRFKLRENMILTNIQWTEDVASLNYTFTFNEAMTADILETDVQINKDDSNLPISDMTILDFTDTLLDWSEIDKVIYMQLYSLGLVDDKFTDDVIYYLNIVATGYAGGVIAGGAATLASLAVTFTAIGSIPVAGWIVTGAIATIGFIVGGIWAGLQTFKRKKAEKEYAVKAFKHYKDDRKKQQEVERYANYVGSIHQQIEYLEDAIQVYGISSNIQQECMTYIDNSYYIFDFTINNTQTVENKTVWSCKITNTLTNQALTESDISTKAVTSINECSLSNRIIMPGLSSNIQVYFINYKRLSIENAVYNDDKERQIAIDKCNSDLSSYYLMISKIDMTEFNSILADLVVNAMKV